MQTNAIRQHFRQLRRSLSESEQQRHARQVAERLNQLLTFKRDQRIAAYLATQGELSLNDWIHGNAWHRLYLPRLYEVSQPQLRFAAITQDTRWRLNRFRIAEPDGNWGQTLHARQLDIVLLPLVAFDRQGNRLGMGGGYYDRSLAFRNHRRIWRTPKLIGVSHSC